MNGEQEVDRDDSLLLTSEDRANGFSIEADESHNITLLKWGKPVAWFSVIVTGEVLRGFLKLVKDSEINNTRKITLEEGDIAGALSVSK